MFLTMGTKDRTLQLSNRGRKQDTSKARVSGYTEITLLQQKMPETISKVYRIVKEKEKITMGLFTKPSCHYGQK